MTEAKPKTYKIVSLRAENIKRLSAVEITPTGALIEITGKNRQGKTSVLDAMWWAFEGAGNIQAEPIRRGQDKGSVVVDLGGIKVTRILTRKEDGEGFTTSLKVENDEGMKAGSPQELLNKLVGKLSFDPLAFAESDAKAQVSTLRAFVPGLDFEAADKANKDDFTKRTEVNRRVAELRAQIKAFNLPDEIPAAADESAIIAEMEGASGKNAEIESRRSARMQAAESVSRKRANVEITRDRITALRLEIAELEEAAKSDEESATELEAKLKAAPALPELVDTAALSKALQEARDTNEIVSAATSRDALKGRLATAEAEAEALTKAMEERKAAVAKAIAEAKLPVEGLSLGEDGVMLDGLPFDQASDADQLRVSVALAAAANPRLRVARVREGSRFDSETLAMVGKLAEEHDLQVWVETVDSGRPQAIVIVDGHVSPEA